MGLRPNELQPRISASAMKTKYACRGVVAVPASVPLPWLGGWVAQLLWSDEQKLPQRSPARNSQHSKAFQRIYLSTYLSIYRWSSCHRGTQGEAQGAKRGVCKGTSQSQPSHTILFRNVGAPSWRNETLSHGSQEYWLMRVARQVQSTNNAPSYRDHTFALVHGVVYRAVSASEYVRVWVGVWVTAWAGGWVVGQFCSLLWSDER